MPDVRIHAITGAFGYTGSYIARNLLSKGAEVVTLTNKSSARDPFGGRVRAFPMDFSRPGDLVSALKQSKADVLYNTYWVRFNHGNFSHNQAVENTKTLFRAAIESGIKRIVHVSITNPLIDSPYEYFRGKAELENDLASCGISYAILRPAVIFGKEDILINNIAWVIRNLPVFGVFGDGNYRLQPIFVEDFADIAVSQGEHHLNTIIDATGPETYTYRGLAEMIMEAIKIKRPVVKINPLLGYIAGKIIGLIKNDITLTRQEIGALMDGLLCTDSKPSGRTSLKQWAEENAGLLGMNYASELARRNY